MSGAQLNVSLYFKLLYGFIAQGIRSIKIEKSEKFSSKNSIKRSKILQNAKIRFIRNNKFEKNAKIEGRSLSRHQTKISQSNLDLQSPKI